MEKTLKKHTEYEVQIGNKGCYVYNEISEIGTINISAVVDAVDEDCVYEFKCTDMLTLEHKLQLLIYSWLWEKCMMDLHGMRMFKIFNIRTGEVLKLNHTSPKINIIVNNLLKYKYGPKTNLNDDEFIKQCLNV